MSNIDDEQQSINYQTSHRNEPSYFYRPKLQIYDGIERNVTIENWIKLYESSAKRYQWPEEDMLDILGEYLSKDALNFYLCEKDTSSWGELKLKLINRFGVQSVEPLLEFIRLKFCHCKDVTDYFEHKRRLATLAELTEKQAVILMIEDLSEKLKNCFIGHRVNTYDQFFTIAKTAENQISVFNVNTSHGAMFNGKNRFGKKTYHHQPNNKFNNSSEKKQTTPFVKRPPRNPCWTCQNAGKPEQYHWSEDCPIKKERPPKVNFIQNDKSNQSDTLIFPQNNLN